MAKFGRENLLYILNGEATVMSLSTFKHYFEFCVIIANLKMKLLLVAHQVDITQFINPEAVDGSGDLGKIVLLKATVDIFNSFHQPTENPTIQRLFLTTRLKNEIQFSISK